MAGAGVPIESGLTALVLRAGKAGTESGAREAWALSTRAVGLSPGSTLLVGPPDAEAPQERGGPLWAGRLSEG